MDLGILYKHKLSRLYTFVLSIGLASPFLSILYILDIHAYILVSILLVMLVYLLLSKKGKNASKLAVLLSFINLAIFILVVY
jgi:uncharacterized membrane protein YjjP (DUF1212 family)